MEASLREWWLGFAGGPELLFTARLVVAGFTALGLFMAGWNVVKPNSVEAVWEHEDYVKAMVLNVFKVLGYGGFLFYLIYGGIVESERTSSPHRLLFADACLFFWAVGDAGLMIMRRFTNIHKREAARQLERSLR